MSDTMDHALDLLRIPQLYKPRVVTSTTSEEDEQSMTSRAVTRRDGQSVGLAWRHVSTALRVKQEPTKN